MTSLHTIVDTLPEHGHGRLPKHVPGRGISHSVTIRGQDRHGASMVIYARGQDPSGRQTFFNDAASTGRTTRGNRKDC